jgi:anti-sigma regulatory factor (Ser/Thr protein kinase)
LAIAAVQNCAMTIPSRLAWQSAPSRLSLTLPNDRRAVGQCREVATRFLTEAGIGPRTLYDVELALEEILMNIVWHAHADAVPHTIAVDVAIGDAEVVLCIEDDGRPFDPTEASRSAAPRTIAEAKPGGLGLLLVHAAVRDASYARVGGRNRLTLRIAFKS